jgi:transcriptional regulator with XRE-family HTH domain
MGELDHERVARELVRALRGRRSQVAVSRRLGYRSNVVYQWEAGRRWPTAAELLRMAGKCRVDPREALGRWYRTPPAWLAEVDPATGEGVARLLRHEVGETPIGAVAARAGRNRYSVSRWIRGDAEPRLPDFLRVLEAASLRSVDFVAALVGPDAVPAATEVWARREARRNAAIEEPWSQAVLRALDLGLRDPAEVGPRLGIPEDRLARAVDVLVRAGQVERDGDELRPLAVEALDTRRSEASARRLKGFWARVGTDRLEAGDPGAFAYNLFTVSRSQLARLEEMHHAYWRAVRAVVAEDEPPEVVALLNLQLLRLDRP